jgi:hypothetical protein
MFLQRSAAPIIAATFVAAVTPAVCVAQSTGLEDMVGARAGQAEAAIQNRGYRYVRGEKGDDRSYTYWWNADRRQCVTISTVDGRYGSLTPTTPPDCRQPAASRGRPESKYASQYDSQLPYGVSGNRPGRLPDDEGAVVQGRSVDLGLVCFGDGSRDGIASGTRWRWNRDRDRYEYDNYNESTREQFDATLTVQLWNGGGRVRLPKSLVPPLNSRGNNGWWDLYAVSVGRDTINASYRLNGLNKPRVTIDRRSGRIEVQGFSSYGFRGRCDEIGHEQRRF